MNKAAISPRVDADAAGPSEMRGAERFTLLIRAAKLIGPQGEFVCVIRDVSETGISVRLFHALPHGDLLELQMPGGHTYQVRPVWERGNEAGFEFVSRIEIEKLISEAGEYPKRGLRFGVCFPVEASTRTSTCECIAENLSQQGARLQCSGLFSTDQTIRLRAKGLKDISAKVRWRRDSSYGVVFDDTFTLGDFARLLVQLQAPALLNA